MNPEMRQEANDIQRTNAYCEEPRRRQTYRDKEGENEKSRKQGTKKNEVLKASIRAVTRTYHGPTLVGRSGVGPGPTRSVNCSEDEAATRSGPSIFQKMGRGPA